MKRDDPEYFSPYEYLNRINDLVAGKPVDGERVMLTNSYRATDLGAMLKTALIAIEIIAEEVGSGVAKRP